MKIKSIYKSILKREHLWNYYNQDFEEIVLANTKNCADFIKGYIKYAQKYKTLLFENVDYLMEHSPQRLTHILSLNDWLTPVIRNNNTLTITLNY